MSKETRGAFWRLVQSMTMVQRRFGGSLFWKTPEATSATSSGPKEIIKSQACGKNVSGCWPLPIILDGYPVTSASKKKKKLMAVFYKFVDQSSKEPLLPSMLWDAEIESATNPVNYQQHYRDFLWGTS